MKQIYNYFNAYTKTAVDKTIELIKEEDIQEQKKQLQKDVQKTTQLFTQNDPVDFVSMNNLAKEKEYEDRVLKLKQLCGPEKIQQFHKDGVLYWHQQQSILLQNDLPEDFMIIARWYYKNINESIRYGFIRIQKQFVYDFVTYKIKSQVLTGRQVDYGKSIFDVRLYHRDTKLALDLDFKADNKFYKNAHDIEFIKNIMKEVLNLFQVPIEARQYIIMKSDDFQQHAPLLESIAIKNKISFHVVFPKVIAKNLDHITQTFNTSSSEFIKELIESKAIDLSIYSYNGQLRMLYCRKPDQDNTLRIVEQNLQIADERTLFNQTILQAFIDPSSFYIQKPMKMLVNGIIVDVKELIELTTGDDIETIICEDKERIQQRPCEVMQQWLKEQLLKLKIVKPNDKSNIAWAMSAIAFKYELYNEFLDIYNAFNDMQRNDQADHHQNRYTAMYSKLEKRNYQKDKIFVTIHYIKRIMKQYSTEFDECPELPFDECIQQYADLSKGWYQKEFDKIISKGNLEEHCLQIEEPDLKDVSMNFQLMNQYDNLLCLSDMGTGKSKHFLLKLQSESNSKVFIQVTSRIDLSFQVLRDNINFNAIHYYDKLFQQKLQSIDYRLKTVIIIEYESLYKIKDFIHKLIEEDINYSCIIDEFMTLYKQQYALIQKEFKEQNQTALVKALYNCRQMILLDAHPQLETVNYFHKLHMGSFYGIFNSYIKGGVFEAHNDLKGLYREIIKALNAGNRVAFCCNYKVLMEGLKTAILLLFPDKKIALFCRDDEKLHLTQDEITQFRQEQESFLENYDIVMYNQRWLCGISLIKQYDYFCYFDNNNLEDIFQVRQMIGRIRSKSNDVINICVNVSNKAIPDDFRKYFGSIYHDRRQPLKIEQMFLLFPNHEIRYHINENVKKQDPKTFFDNQYTGMREDIREEQLELILREQQALILALEENKEDNEEDNQALIPELKRKYDQLKKSGLSEEAQNMLFMKNSINTKDKALLHLKDNISQRIYVPRADLATRDLARIMGNKAKESEVIKNLENEFKAYYDNMFENLKRITLMNPVTTNSLRSLQYNGVLDSQKASNDFAKRVFKFFEIKADSEVQDLVVKGVRSQIKIYKIREQKTFEEYFSKQQ